MKCSSHFCIHQVPIFNHLSEEEMMEISKVVGHKKYQKGELVFLSGDPSENLFIIQKGKIKISRISETGREQILRILQPGEFLGELSLFGSALSYHNAETLEKTEVCFVHRQDLNHLVQQFPNIAVKILEACTKRLESAESLIEQLGLQGVEQRVAGILLQLAVSEDLLLAMSKRDLASLIGTTSETLSRKLSHFQDQGWIKLIGHRRIRILDRKSLLQITSS
jgi:CRP/FNR family transcriptional regulator, anaerobic regulatory protein